MSQRVGAEQSGRGGELFSAIESAAAPPRPLDGLENNGHVVRNPPAGPAPTSPTRPDAAPPVRATTILVADRVPLFRAAARAVLGCEGEFDVIEVATADEIVALIEGDSHVDIALIDLDCWSSSMFDTIRLLRERCDAQVIVWSFAPDPETVLSAIRAGATCFLHKQTSPEDLLLVLNGTARGETPLARASRERVIHAAHTAEDKHLALSRVQRLAERERESLTEVPLGAVEALDASIADTHPRVLRVAVHRGDESGSTEVTG